MTSARAWHGCSSSDRALTTGTEAAAASSTNRSWPKVRITIALQNRERIRAVSEIVSPRPSCTSSGFNTTGCPPSSPIATSKETRVRVDGFSKSIATERPSRLRACSRRRFFRSTARRITAACSAAVRSSEDRK